MASASLAARLVEVIADRGESAAERYVYGSGCIVRGRTVLTAAHVVAGAQTVQVRDPNKRMYSATVDPRFVGDANGPGPDLALVEIDDPAVDLAPIGLAQVDRDGSTDDPVERCHAVGYPWFAETPLSDGDARHRGCGWGDPGVVEAGGRAVERASVHLPAAATSRGEEPGGV